MAKVSRRDFLKYVGAGGAGAGAGILIGESREQPVEYLMPLVEPPPGYIPGVATYYNTLCTQCSAGCGITVRIREGRAKKIEGNPLHPVSQGRTCALGQAGLNALYNPDRIRQPLRRTGDRGSAAYEDVSWDEALTELGERLGSLVAENRGEEIALLTGTVRGHLHDLLERFAGELGSQSYLQYDFTTPENLYAANEICFGTDRLPYYDIHNTDYLLSFGADIAGTWISPVHHSLGLGQMRQGRPGSRGHFVYVEPRMNLTAASADEWIPAAPGTEGLFALALAHVIFDGGQARVSDPYNWSDVLRAYSPGQVAERIGVDAERITTIAAGLASAKAALVVGGGAAASGTNGVANMVAINALNYLLGNLGRRGGLLLNPAPVLPAPETRHRAGFRRMREFAGQAQAGGVDTLITFNTNPVFNLPTGSGFHEALAGVPFVVSLSSFLDETTAMADLVLPVSTYLEVWGDESPEPGVGVQIASLSQPVVETDFTSARAAGDIVLALAKNIGGGVASAMPFDSFEDFLKAGWQTIYERDHPGATSSDFGAFWKDAARSGVWLRTTDSIESEPVFLAAALEKLRFAEPEFGGDGPYVLQPYLSQGLWDGRGANLPWMQELPDPMTSVVYTTWIELNPATAEDLGLREGDVVRVRSPSGEFEAPVVPFNGIRPDVVGVPIGQGHEHYGRYAQGRGVNPLRIVGEKSDSNSGTHAWGATRVALEKTGRRVHVIKTGGTSRDLGRNILGRKEIQFLGE